MKTNESDASGVSTAAVQRAPSEVAPVRTGVCRNKDGWLSLEWEGTTVQAAAVNCFNQRPLNRLWASISVGVGGVYSQCVITFSADITRLMHDLCDGAVFNWQRGQRFNQLSRQLRHALNLIF